MAAGDRAVYFEPDEGRGGEGKRPVDEGESSPVRCPASGRNHLAATLASTTIIRARPDLHE